MEKKLLEEKRVKTESESKIVSKIPHRTGKKRTTYNQITIKTEKDERSIDSLKLELLNTRKTFSKDVEVKRRKSVQGKNLFLKKKYKCIKRYSNAHQDFIEKLIILKNGKIASLSYDFTIKIWDIEGISKKPIFILKGHSNRVTDIIQYTNTLIASVSQDKTIRKWNMNTGKEIYCYEMKHPFFCICPATDITVCCGGSDKTLRFYDLSVDKQIEELFILEGHSDVVTCLIQVNSFTIASGSSDNSIRFWDFEKRKHLFTLEGHSSGISCLKLLKDKRFASGSYDNSIIIWNLEKRDIEIRLKHSTGHILSITQLNDGRIVSGNTDWSISIWNLKNENVEHTFEAHDEAVSCVAATPNGKIISCSRDRNIKVWD